jgi:hypothetical protein
MSVIAMSIPTALIIMMRTMGAMPVAKIPKLSVELTTVAFGLYLGLPFSVAIFPNLNSKRGSACETQFKIYD